MAVVWLTGHCPSIPVISNNELDALYARIKPVKHKTVEGTAVLHQLQPTELRLQSFLFDPAWGEPVQEPLYEHARIETYHTTGYGALFKPSVAEVLAQVPEHLRREVDFFETLDEDTVAVYSEHDGHRTVTVLYSRDAIGSEGWKKRIYG
jgi:hypothetical protein